MKNKLQFHNLRAILPTPESIIQLSIFTGIPITNINNWLDLNSKVVPKADELVVISKYFGCSVDWLLDLDGRGEL